MTSNHSSHPALFTKPFLLFLRDLPQAGACQVNPGLLAFPVTAANTLNVITYGFAATAAVARCGVAVMGLIDGRV